MTSRGVEKAAIRWFSQTALVFLTPWQNRLLRRLTTLSLNRLLQIVLSRLDPASPTTESIIVTDMMLVLLAEALNGSRPTASAGVGSLKTDGL